MNELLNSLADTPASPDLDKEISSPSSHYSPGISTSVEDRAISLLGSGVSAESTASALGVTPSRIAQLLSEEMFSDKVAELRYKNLQAHNMRDGEYDSLEDELIAKLKKALPLIIRPESIIKAITVINGAKRRGQTAPEQVTNNDNIVNLILPACVAAQFSININNQVTKAGDQELLTIPSGNLLKQVEEAEAQRALEYTAGSGDEEKSNVSSQGSSP